MGFENEGRLKIGVYLMMYSGIYILVRVCVFMFCALKPIIKAQINNKNTFITDINFFLYVEKPQLKKADRIEIPKHE